MTALGKLVSNSTAFKLTLVYLTVFALFAALLLGYFAWNTRRLITEQITETVDAEITGLTEQYTQGGIRRLVLIIDARARAARLEPLSRHRRRPAKALAGNVGSLAPGVLDQPGWTETDLSPARRAGDGRASRAGARVRSCPAASGCWSAATSRSARGCTTSSWRRRAGRSRWSSCSALPAASSSRGACCAASTP